MGGCVDWWAARRASTFLRQTWWASLLSGCLCLISSYSADNVLGAELLKATQMLLLLMCVANMNRGAQHGLLSVVFLSCWHWGFSTSVESFVVSAFWAGWLPISIDDRWHAPRTNNRTVSPSASHWSSWVLTSSSSSSGPPDSLCCASKYSCAFSSLPTSSFCCVSLLSSSPASSKAIRARNAKSMSSLCSLISQSSLLWNCWDERHNERNQLAWKETPWQLSFGWAGWSCKRITGKALKIIDLVSKMHLPVILGL